MIINDKIYGKQEIIDPIILELIATSEMQRLKHINQYGVWDLFDPKYFTSRFDHSVGAYLLLRKFNAPREEQIAGLLHDISHTAFSHVIDYVFDDSEFQSVHERFHQQVIFDSQIPAIIKKYSLDINHIIDEHNFPLLENNLPDICADRLDYFLRDSSLIGITTPQEIQIIQSALIVHHNEFVFNHPDAAYLASTKFIQTCQQFWGSPLQSGSYTLMSNILKRALDKKIITERDFFSTDKSLLKKLKDCQDKDITNQFDLFSYDRIIESTKEDYTFHTKSKARYIDPKILINGQLKHTTELFPQLQQQIDTLKEKFKQGYYIKIV